MASILVVDDSPTEIHVFKTMLEKHGHSVSTAQSGEEGVERAKEVKPDLILMDVVMPGLNGFQATRQLGNDASTSHIPVIVVTTKDQETDKVWAMRQGAKDYIVKPAKEQDLIERINSILG
jgi:twitching motility two-component system response regulator PilH